MYQANPPKVSRRRFLLGGLGLTGALVIGWGVLPPRQRLDAEPPLGLSDQIPLNGWVLISPDNRVTVMLAKSEMGQGISTALPMLVAEELDVPLSSISLVQAPPRKIYGDTSMLGESLPFHPDEHGRLKRSLQWLTAKTMRELGIMVTGGSSSVKDSWVPMREAGAAARARLIAAAAAAWKLPAIECETDQGAVIHRSGQRASYGELVAAAAAIGPVPFNLKQPEQFRLIGTDVPRRDVADKVNGRAGFGLDTQLPGMLYACVVMSPILGGTLASGVSSEALAQIKNTVDALPGIKKILALPPDRSGSPAAMAVVAETRWSAIRAVDLIKLDWQAGPEAKLSSEALHSQLGSALENDSGFSYYQRGDMESVAPDKTLNAEYQAPFLAHAALEPVNCTAQFVDGRIKLWLPTQVPTVAITTAARAAGIDASQIDLHVTLLGGGFGRRLDNDMVFQAVRIALACEGTPVQLLWLRAQDMQHDFYRPASRVRLSSALDSHGRMLSWRSHSASGSAAHHLTHRAFGLPKAGPDKTTCEGLFDHAYAIPNQKVSHAIVDSVVPLGTWRSVGHSQNGFFKESFIDELARAAGADPVEFRRQHLQDQPRHLAVLNAAVSLAGQAAPGRALGVALHRSFGSIVAQVAEVSVTQGQIRVHKVSCAVDCGLAVHPEGVRQQMESAIAFGLTAALYGEITLSEGRVQQSNFHDYPCLRMAEMPQVEVAIINSGEHPEGVGEPGTPPIAPAVANAVFQLTGQRLRSLPLRLAAA
jgi:isoquinoline 1-oxidoreductase beta subunit